MGIKQNERKLKIERGIRASDRQLLSAAVIRVLFNWRGKSSELHSEHAMRRREALLLHF